MMRLKSTFIILTCSNLQVRAPALGQIVLGSSHMSSLIQAALKRPPLVCRLKTSDKHVKAIRPIAINETIIAVVVTGAEFQA